MTYTKHLFVVLSIVLMTYAQFSLASDVGTSGGAPKSIAREWNEILLDSIRSDSARPTVHARNLWHQSLLFWNCLVAYRNSDAPGWLFTEKVSQWATPISAPELDAALNQTISYASYTFLKWRFQLSPGKDTVETMIANMMNSKGYPTTVEENGGENPAELGLRIAEAIINFGLSDNANELNDYNNTIGYTSMNPKLEVSARGSPDWEEMDPNRYQDLFLLEFVGQSGILETEFPPFVSPHWGLVTPFALTEADASCPDGGWNGSCVAPVYLDPGAPPKVEDEEWALEYLQVSIDSSLNDATDGVMVDIGPRSSGNNPFGTNDGTGYSVNPVTGEPYQPVLVPRGDYTRVLAEFWADGPDSETPPGHWNTILNYVNDQPETTRKLGGSGEVLARLDWDILSYFVLNGALHDSAVSAWSVKGHYDTIRPVGAIRYMCEAGQRSDPNLPRYHPNGVVLIPGFVEMNYNTNKFDDLNVEENAIMLYTWKGTGPNSQTVPQGTGWIHCGDWMPFQRTNFVSPPFAGYVSGHSTFSRAAAEVIAALTGTEYFPGGIGTFLMKQNEALVLEEGPSQDVSLSWATYYDAADESGLSRRYGGIHPKFDDTPGRYMGKTIGEKAFEMANTEYFSLVDFKLPSEVTEPTPSPPPTPSPTPTPTPIPTPPPSWPAPFSKGKTIGSLVMEGQPCHGGNVFNDEPISDWQEIAATFENQDWANIWTNYPVTQGPFYAREMGVIEPGATQASSANANSDPEAIVATWVAPETEIILGVDLSDPSIAARANVPYRDVQSFFGQNVEYSPIDLTDPTDPTKDGQFRTTRTMAYEEITLGKWNSAKGKIHLKCYENEDGVRSGSYDLKVKDLLPHSIYTVWAVNAGSTNEVSAPILPSMFGGMPSIIVTDENGDGSLKRDLGYCPLKIENPLMYIALAVHPDGIVWGTQFYGGTNPFPLGGGDHLCFNLGDSVSNFLSN